MMDRPLVQIPLRLVLGRVIDLVLRHYLYLHIRLRVFLIIQYILLKAAGAALIEAVKIEYCIKSMSKEYRVIFAACIAMVDLSAGA